MYFSALQESARSAIVVAFKHKLGMSQEKYFIFLNLDGKPVLINYACGEWEFGGGRAGKVREVVTSTEEKETKLQVILI